MQKSSLTILIANEFRGDFRETSLCFSPPLHTAIGVCATIRGLEVEYRGVVGGTYCSVSPPLHAAIGIQQRYEYRGNVSDTSGSVLSTSTFRDRALFSRAIGVEATPVTPHSVFVHLYKPQSGYVQLLS